jgi:tetratricopeptide (TPR) repeat protein
MRINQAVAIGLSLCVCSVLGAQVRPPGTQQGQIQADTDKSALAFAEQDLARSGGQLGALDMVATGRIRLWGSVVDVWRKERGAGAAPHLATGVLFDCLSRLHDVLTMPVSFEKSVPFFPDLAAARPQRAAEAFESALKVDPTLIEARMRAARLRAPKQPAAVTELERIAVDETAYPFSYLAAISRAEVARNVGDLAGAARWYRKALLLYPQSVAASIALSLLVPEARPPLENAGEADLYYTYPCTVMTLDVDTALAARMRLVNKK